jgi:3-oxoacyl-[acyl-carrier protein] reductase
MRTGPGVAGERRDVDLGLSGRRAIVCASSQGIGLACARALAREGATVLINGRDPERLERAIEALSAEGLSARKLAADVTIEEGRRALLATCPEPDILVTNSGGPKLGDFRDWSVADWETSLNQYMIAPIQLIRGVVDGMIARRFGRIVNLSSRAVRAPPPFSGLSTGGRAGLAVFAAGLAREVARYNVTINNLLPGRSGASGRWRRWRASPSSAGSACRRRSRNGSPRFQPRGSESSKRSAATAPTSAARRPASSSARAC